MIFDLDMDEDAEKEYIFVPSGMPLRAILLFDKATGNNCKTGENSWSYIGKMEANTVTIDRQALLDAIKGSKLVTAEPKYKDLKSGRFEFRLSRGF
ncbi:MAG: hypothetical protein HYV24_02130 [Deltaproteobacteria bacterium]|nr:hypothetical protein [Deltaproteobacteria bacterium]